MAAQADFLHDFSTRTQTNLLDEFESRQLHGLNPLLLNNYYKIKGCISNPQSELTVNGSGSKKRNREESSLMDLTTPTIHFGGYDSNVIGAVADPLVSTDGMRVIDSVGTSTSGRISCASTSSPVAQDLLDAYLHNQSLEIDAMIRLQNERLRLGLEQAQKRHCRSLISLLKQQLVRKLEEKDAELENTLRKNAELEEKVRQMSMENQIWYNFAKNNEAIVANLKASLEQVLQNVAVDYNTVQAKEGYGDSDGVAFPADDAQSCCFFEDAERERTNGAVKIVTAKEGRSASPTNSCKMCEKEAGVLLLPCRHLCLCVECESKVDTCPVCHVARNASLQIFMG